MANKRLTITSPSIDGIERQFVKATDSLSHFHCSVRLAILVAGGGAGSMKGGRHIRYAEPTPLANLHLTLLEKVGVRMDSFADSKSKVKELLEPLSLS